jgi:hypothetical protein
MKFRKEISEAVQEIKVHSWISNLRISAILDHNKYEKNKRSSRGKT